MPSPNPNVMTNEQAEAAAEAILNNEDGTQRDATRMGWAAMETMLERASPDASDDRKEYYPSTAAKGHQIPITETDPETGLTDGIERMLANPAEDPQAPESTTDSLDE